MSAGCGNGGGKASGHVIIGNCAAGIAAAEAIREAGCQEPLSIITDEEHPAYGRPLTSYVLGGRVSRDQIWLRPPDFYGRLAIDILFGQRAAAVDSKEKSVVIEGGGKLRYDRLLIASGGSPRKLPVPGADLAGVFYLRTVADSDAIIGHLPRTRRVVLCGGGLVTAKAMDALRHVDTVESMSMVEIMPAVLSQVLDGEPAAIMEQHFRENGVDVRTETSIEEVLGREGRVAGVRLSSGEVLDCEMVIVGMGVIPNTGFLAGSGIKTDFGILVDSCQRTSVQDVFSAGDVAQVPDFFGDGSRVCAIWPAACQQGRVAGLNMAGREAVYRGGVGMNSAEFFGLPVIAAGMTKPGEGREAFDYRSGEKQFRRIVLKDGVVVGYVLLGEVSCTGVLTAMIYSRRKLNGTVRDVLAADLSNFIRS
ncbi:MAG: NAD(P)/FAD-dependent oxidoreductase [Thermoleophilia bacterium]|nr:NAD(P)/FAD-dependent oxidoreductase [Thermoleophilia bacterium]